MRRIIREDEPPRPSKRLSTLKAEQLSTVADRRGAQSRSLSVQIRGELDWIVMKALEKDRNRRYESAGAFAVDVLRYLDDEPVQACPPSAGYRLRKFARRHKGPVAAAAVVLLTLVAGITGTTWGLIRAQQAWKAEAERADAEREARGLAQKRLAQIERGYDLIGSIFKDLDPKAEEKEAKPLRALLGERLDRAARELQGDAVGDPLVMAKLQVTLGASLRGLGYPEKAVALFLPARVTYSAELGLDHSETLAVTNDLFWAYYDATKMKEALPLFEEAFESAKRKLGPENAATLSYMDRLARAYNYGEKSARAVTLFEETVELRKATLGREHRDTLASMHGLAWAYVLARQAPKGRQLFEDTLRLQSANLGPDHPDTIDTMRRLAGAYGITQNHDQSVALRDT
jgi:hypothetical protein